ncbi:geranylgeranyl pyrophosphate synthase-like protein [Kickxella alabastrina]|uniref:geranylgeranyl pyrophosphate synthase-like protein n=1 Tax=Kickxella alabastrina TaxID=61397 RepID=UPI00221E509C|nr:geranylgeranyl pyrophosphate synthase-like protein [Kickxella alabastrina]KAI7828368.1 geranylgeranyl pyrophosphate synthase-like protein [Kickxella alabastrina]
MPAFNNTVQEKIILAPYEYLAKMPGKEVRTMIINAFNSWLHVDLSLLLEISSIIRKLHTSSLLLDNIEDSSELRRGVPAAHTIYGIPMALNAENYVYCISTRGVLQMKRPKIMEVFTEELMNLHRGQGLELFWRDTLSCPTGKVFGDGLFRLAVKMLQECSEVNVDFTDLADMMGTFFQIRDGYMNLLSTEYSNSKGFCEDLTEGKFSFLILMSILRQKTDNEIDKLHAVSLIAKAGSFEYTRKSLITLEDKIGEKIAEHGGNAVLEDLMAKLSIKSI